VQPFFVAFFGGRVFNSDVPNQRAEGMKFVGAWCPSEVTDAVESWIAREKKDARRRVNRSDFLLEAAMEKLARSGIAVAEEKGFRTGEVRATTAAAGAGLGKFPERDGEREAAAVSCNDAQGVAEAAARAAALSAFPLAPPSPVADAPAPPPATGSGRATAAYRPPSKRSRSGGKRRKS
jgi:hypothetical protein